MKLLERCAETARQALPACYLVGVLEVAVQAAKPLAELAGRARQAQPTCCDENVLEVAVPAVKMLGARSARYWARWPGARRAGHFAAGWARRELEGERRQCIG